MSANSNLLLFLVTLHSFLSTGYCTASTTLLITGHSSDNNYKYAFAQKFVSQVELDRAHSADFLAISSDSIDAAREEEGVVLRTIGGVQLVGNLSQLVISNLGSNEMSLEHIQLLFKYIDTDQPLIVVEIGEQSVQTKSLLNKGALCWGEARANILSPNKAYICNDVPEETVRAIVDFQSVRGLTDPERNVMVEPQPRQFWPSFFASAARTEKKRRRKEEIIEVDEEEDVDEIVDQIMQDLQEREEHAESVSEHKHVVDHKLHCKYRKSCYESGTRPEIESVDHPWFDWFDFDVSNWFASKETKDEEKEGESEEKKDSGEDDDEDDDEEDITPLKLKCKYRLDCYKRKGIRLSGKDEEREKRKSLLAGKASVQQGKKRTLKDIAERTISRVKVAEEKAAARPLPKAIVAERKLNEIEEKLNEKLQCKYRKSCYETGEPPVIEPSTWGLPTFSTYSAEEAVEQVDFEEMEDLEKKMFCKYRKSCYETGVKPDIEPDIQITSFHDLKQIPDVIESSRKMTLQEKCKYRKSCYETGILPEINPALEKIVEKEVSTVIPTNVNDLRKFCKYRKSCYEEIAESASVETVRNIRKRRLIEREVKRRKARRARMRRRLRGGDVELDSISRAVRRKHHASSSNDTAKKSHRARRYTVEEKSESPEPEVQKEEVAEEQQTPEPEETKKKTGKRKTKEMAEEAVEEIAETVEEAVIAPPRRGGKSRKQKAQEPEEVPQPEPEPEEPKSQPKSRGKKKKEVLEEPVVEQESKEEEEKVEEPKPKRGKKREVKQEEEKVKEEAPQEEEPEEPKVIRRKGKKPAPTEPPPAEDEKPEEVEEPVVEKVVITASEGKPKKGKKHREPEPEPQEKEEEHGHHKEHVDYKELQKLQMHCKYRKSCYETKERPVIVQTMATLFSSFDAHVNEHYDRVEKEVLSEANQKLACKYRKSCYESGELPDLRRETEEEEVEVKKHKEQLKKIHTPKKQPVVEMAEEESKEDVSEDEKEPEKVHEHEKFHHLDVDQKLECKYRKSCYGSTKPKKFERTVVTAEGTVHRKKCNEYYLSCREQMGLPPKEKAPMGPNGRRLCRKKKTDQ